MRRRYIAAYVWMTGFGNFSYYYVKKDFTAVRFTQMMWRLNFFVGFVCLTMNNEYMLYYICPMHTFFTWGVFIPLFILKASPPARPAAPRLAESPERLSLSLSPSPSPSRSRSRSRFLPLSSR